MGLGQVRRAKTGKLFSGSNRPQITAVFPRIRWNTTIHDTQQENTTAVNFIGKSLMRKEGRICNQSVTGYD